MRISLVTSQVNKPSTIFYTQNLELLRKQDVSFKLCINPDDPFLKTADVILYMGYDAHTISNKMNTQALKGLVEPRPLQSGYKGDFDFFIVNSLESRDFFLKYNKTIFLYYIYPIVPKKNDCAILKDKFTIAYHGNKIHLKSMMPRIIDAIQKVSEKSPLDLWCMYNIEELGAYKDIVNMKGRSFGYKEIQYSEENYSKFIAHADLGVVPQLIPVNSYKRKFITPIKRTFNEDPNDYLLRYKVTTNLGRTLVFAQYGIPVISDITPSSVDFIGEECGSCAYSSAAWESAITRFLDPLERKAAGKKIKDKFNSIASPNIQNIKLLEFLSKLKQSSSN